MGEICEEIGGLAASIKPHPLPSPPLEREGIYRSSKFSDAASSEA